MGKQLALANMGERTLIMGILNVTDDSFSDGGLYNTLPKALNKAQELVAAGADLIDVGAESTRPGAKRVSEAEELARTTELIATLSQQGIKCSIDTMRASVAKAALEAGAVIVNDVSGGLADAEMFPLIAATGANYVLMHWRSHAEQAMQQASYDNVTAEVIDHLKLRIAAAEQAGIKKEALILDPGLGFSKHSAHNWQLLREIKQLEALGLPLLIGASRKRFLKSLAVDVDIATATLSAISALRGHFAVRVHDVAATKAALSVVEALAIPNETWGLDVSRS